MAKIDMHRPYFRFNDDGNLEAFDADGKKIDPTKSTLREILEAHPDKEMEFKAITMVTLRDPALDDPCFELVYIPEIGWVWIEVPCS